MKINVLALALTALVGCGVGGVLWWDAQHRAAPSASATPTRGTPEATRFGPSGTGGAPAVSREAAPAANGLYRCQGPKGVLYQAEPCPSGTMSRGTQFSPLMGIENSPPGSSLGLFRTDEAGFQLLFQPVRVATNVQRDGVMQ